MSLTEILNSSYVFLIKLRIQIKCLPEDRFNELLKDERLDYTQRLYLCYFRYMQEVQQNENCRNE